MCNDLTDDRKAEIAFNTALEARKLELQLFWTRSLFFWGFIAVTFAAYGKLHQDLSNLSVIAACFGLVCSFAWSLSNRGNKFWYESWETKVKDIEKRVTGKIMFAGPAEVSPDKKIVSDLKWWKNIVPALGRKEIRYRFFEGKRFSVSRLAIAMSDYTVFIWLFLIAMEIYKLLNQSPLDKSFIISVVLFLIFSLAFCRIMYRSSLPEPEKKDE